jgi:hypothetical protein
MKRKGEPQPKPKQPDFEIDPEVLEEIRALESAPWYITAFQRGDPNLPGTRQWRRSRGATTRSR